MYVFQLNCGVNEGTTKVAKEKVILGIDPGTNVMGYGLVLVEGKKYSIIQYGVIHLKKYESHELKLKKIFERIAGIIDEFHPDMVRSEERRVGKECRSRWGTDH